MPILIYIALLGWIPICLLLFMALPPRRAVIVAVVGGWLVLPPTGIQFSGIPDYDKVVAPAAGVLLGTLIFQPNRLLAFRPRWFDLPALVWCLCPFISSLANGLGTYDGVSASIANLERWTLPYLIGRLYFGDREGMRELAVGIAVGGIIWILPCLYEIKMSPVLLSRVYGLNRFEGTRLGSWRPFVFFSTGLELGMWMTASSLTALWLWWCGSLKRIGRFPLGTQVLPVLLLTTFLCRATGAFLALLIAGAAILWLCTRLGTKRFFYALLIVPPLYYSVRIPDLWSGNELVAFIETYINKDRADSLAFRFEKEALLTDKAMLQPAWGWGGWGRSRIVDERTGRDTTPTDGMWVIYLGSYGLVGLAAWTTFLLLPSWFFVIRVPVRLWRDPGVAPLAVMAMLLGIYAVDCLFNGFMNLSYVLAAGGLMGAVSSPSPGKGPAARRKAGRHDRLAASPGTPAAGHEPEPLLPARSASSPQERLADRYRQLSRKLRAQGQPAEAKAMLTYAFELLIKLAAAQPDDHDLQRQRRDCGNDLAWLLLNEPEPEPPDLLLAVDLARQATAADPEIATYWNTLGAACCRTGDPAGALAALERSMSLNDGGTAFDYVFLSLAQSRLGHQDEACHWLARSESWIEQHGADQADLMRLVEEARGCLTAR